MFFEDGKFRHPVDGRCIAAWSEKAAEINSYNLFFLYYASAPDQYGARETLYRLHDTFLKREYSRVFDARKITTKRRGWDVVFKATMQAWGVDQTHEGMMNEVKRWNNHAHTGK